jgi:hypothetical protein
MESWKQDVASFSFVGIVSQTIEEMRISFNKVHYY